MLVQCQGICPNYGYGNASASVKLILTPEEVSSTPAYKIGEFLHGLLSRVCSAVSHHFAPNLPVASAQALPALTVKDMTFLTDLEILVKLATNAPQDRRYLRMVRAKIDAYMKEHDVITFPRHMERAHEVLDYLNSEQNIALNREEPFFGDEKPLEKDCFYAQLKGLVEEAAMICDLESIINIQTIQKLMQVFLEKSESKALPSDVEQKFVHITNQLSAFQRKLLTR